MKTYFFILLVFTGYHCQSQTGIDGAVAGAGHLVLWDMEKNDLDHISATQNYIISSNVLLSLEEAKLLDISKQRYESLSKKDISIENAAALAQILTHGEQLYSVNEDILDITNGYPAVQLMILPAISDLFIEQAFLIADVVQSTTDGSTNLMNSADRLIHLKRIVTEIDKLNLLGNEIYNLAQALIVITDFPDPTIVEPMTYDFTEVYEQLQTDIDNLINE